MARSSEVVPFGATPAGGSRCRLPHWPKAVVRFPRKLPRQRARWPASWDRRRRIRCAARWRSSSRAPHADDGLQWLHEAGVLQQVVPELDATVNFSQEAGRRHKDVWEHTKQVVMQSPAQPIVRWAALLHDIGKVDTRVMLSEGKVTFHRHAEVGARLFETLARRLGFASRRAQAHPLSHRQPPARQRLRVGMDRRSRASIRSRNGRRSARARRAVASRRHLGTARPAPGSGPQYRGAVADE